LRKNTCTSFLRSEIKTTFFKHIQSLGFDQQRINDSNSLSYFFYRERGELRDLVEVQFDQYHRPKFVIEFGFCPSGGIVDSYGREVPAKNVRCYQLMTNGRLYKSLFLSIGKWFSVSLIEIGIFGNEEAANREINKAVRNFKQVDEWLRNGTVGSDISIKKNTHNEPGSAKYALMAKGLWPPEGWTEKDEQSLVL
jgi:hypothetical protein